jgi:hypothetical protein
MVVVVEDQYERSPNRSKLPRPVRFGCRIEPAAVPRRQVGPACGLAQSDAEPEVDAASSGPSWMNGSTGSAPQRAVFDHVAESGYCSVRQYARSLCSEWEVVVYG